MNINFLFSGGKTWLVTGPNGGGKEKLYKQIASSQLTDSTGRPQKIVSVSLETAAELIEEERRRDDSDYIEGGVDIGRTAGVYIAEVLDTFLFASNFSRLEYLPEVQLCGLVPILNRGLKYLSTGEIRRTLLCRALLSRCDVLLLSDPFTGLDSESRRLLFNFFTDITAKQGTGLPHLVLFTERYDEIPESISHVLEYTAGLVHFSGERKKYENLLKKRNMLAAKKSENLRQEFLAQVDKLQTERRIINDAAKNQSSKTNGNQQQAAKEIVRMNNVTVAWSGHRVLDNINWVLYEGEHWLIRGPNGSGKTTFLELITGDNMQVFCNDISIFGHRRGTGETVWEIKEKIGIVSYRLHLEYRIVGSIDLEAVILSGFYDSIGLYVNPSQTEQAAAHKWLKLAGFEGREAESFSSLSYGEQRTVLILRAAVKCPPLLILDEPCQGLDENWRTKILDLLGRIAEAGTTTLLHVTHDPKEAGTFEKRILEFRPAQKPMYSIL